MREPKASWSNIYIYAWPLSRILNKGADPQTMKSRPDFFYEELTLPHPSTYQHRRQSLNIGRLLLFIVVHI